MKLLVQGGRVYRDAALFEADVLVEYGVIRAVGRGLAADGAEVVNATGCVLAPGFCDLHVHLREPGFTDKESIATGTAAAAAGGFTTVCAMPNLAPVPDSLQTLAPQLDAIGRDALVCVLPYAALTVEEKGACPADILPLAAAVAGFSDDGRGVQDEDTMRRCMEKVTEAGGFVAAHCEIDGLLPPPGTGTCVQEGSRFAQAHGYTGHSDESEWAEVKRDIRLAAETGCRLHICHASTAETFRLVREAKAQGLPVTCEVTPHNLLLSCDDILADDGRFKMNPPLRGPGGRDAALAALLDGTADAIATDHAPHTPAEKAGGFKNAMNGVVGLETAFPVLYTRLVQPGRVPLELLLYRLCEAPMGILGAEVNPIAEGHMADFVLLDLEAEREVVPAQFKTKGRASPFEGWTLKGWPCLTYAAGRQVYERGG